MTREEAIKQLSHCEAERYCSHFKQKHHCYGENNGKCNKREALDMAIDALNSEQQIIENGYTGKEMRIRIGGRLFAVRELAQ